MRYLMPALGAAIALAGGDKLAGNRGYARLFRHLGWSDDTRRLVAGMEVVGGVLMMPAATRRVGGVLVASASAVMLASEVQHGDARLAAPRGLVLLAGLAALFAARRPAKVR